MASNTRDRIKSAGRRVGKTAKKATTINGAPGSTTSAENYQEKIVSVDQIRRRAYELFIARGGGHGNDLADWFAAERELRGGELRL